MIWDMSVRNVGSPGLTKIVPSRALTTSTIPILAWKYGDGGLVLEYDPDVVFDRNKISPPVKVVVSNPLTWPNVVIYPDWLFAMFSVASPNIWSVSVISLNDFIEDITFSIVTFPPTAPLILTASPLLITTPDVFLA